jgi:uncharacterized DUF497 family protein
MTTAILAGVVFKWDPNKATANLKKHGIDFYEVLPCLAILSRPHIPTSTIQLRNTGS